MTMEGSSRRGANKQQRQRRADKAVYLHYRTAHKIGNFNTFIDGNSIWEVETSVTYCGCTAPGLVTWSFLDQPGPKQTGSGRAAPNLIRTASRLLLSCLATPPSLISNFASKTSWRLVSPFSLHHTKQKQTSSTFAKINPFSAFPAAIPHQPQSSAF